MPIDGVPPPLPPAALPRAQPLRNVKVLLTLVAAIEALSGLSSLPILFGDLSETPGIGIGGGLIIAHIVSHPLLAIAALVFAARGQLRDATVALGAVVLMTWLNLMPSVVRHGPDMGGSPVAALAMLAQIVAFPLMGACAIALSARDQRPALAAGLVMLPTLCGILGVVFFGVAIGINGF